MTEPQRALVSTISATQSRIEESQLDLEVKAQMPELGMDAASKKWKQVTLDTRKQNVGSQIAAMSAATAKVKIASFKKSKTWNQQTIISFAILSKTGSDVNIRSCR